MTKKNVKWVAFFLVMWCIESNTQSTNTTNGTNNANNTNGTSSNNNISNSNAMNASSMNASSTQSNGTTNGTIDGNNANVNNLNDSSSNSSANSSTNSSTNSSSYMNATNLMNATCDNGLTRAVCLSKSVCLPSCENGHLFKSNDCETRECIECSPGNWCDGTDSYECPMPGMTSPMGSVGEENCRCHDGFFVHTNTNNSNDRKCMSCPEGSWCNTTHAHTCPDGTTSNVLSSEEVHCYCIPGYNHTAINCEERINVKHSLCNTGHFMNANNSCTVCSPGYWCDDVYENTCPIGMSSPYLSTELDDCTCHEGYHRSQCTAVLSFTVTLSMTEDEFDTEMRLVFINTITNALSLPSTSMWIYSVSIPTVSRRLLSSTIEVESRIIVPVSMASDVVQRGSHIYLVTLLADAGIDAIDVSMIIVTYQNKIATVPGVEWQSIIIPIILFFIVFFGLMAWLHKQTDNQYYPMGSERNLHNHHTTFVHSDAWGTPREKNGLDRRIEDPIKWYQHEIKVMQGHY
jgi:hypothetical protein